MSRRRETCEEEEEKMKRLKIMAHLSLLPSAITFADDMSPKKLPTPYQCWKIVVLSSKFFEIVHYFLLISPYSFKPIKYVGEF